MDDRYSKVVLNKSQARQICFCILDSIESYVAEHPKEFEEFLKNEALKEKGVQK